MDGKPEAPASEWAANPKRQRVNGWSRPESTRWRFGLVPVRVLGQSESVEFTNLGPSVSFPVPVSFPFFRAMSLFRQGKKDEARKLATKAVAKMKLLPAAEHNPRAECVDHDDLIMWLAYKETKAMIEFNALRRRRPRTTRNEAGPGPGWHLRECPARRVKNVPDGC